MNFLAHIFLSFDNEDILIGNLVADFIRNKEVENYSPIVQKGIFLHRQIDHYTDNHEVVRQGTKRLQANHHKYAPVVIDILYDYLLANNWEQYSNEPFSDFTQKTYKVLNSRMEEMPLRLKRQLPAMIEHNWLASYKTKEGLQFTFDKMDERTAFPSNFSGAVEDLMEYLDFYNEEFNLFFPEVIQFVKEQDVWDSKMP